MEMKLIVLFLSVALFLCISVIHELIVAQKKHRQELDAQRMARHVAENRYDMAETVVSGLQKRNSEYLFQIGALRSKLRLEMQSYDAYSEAYIDAELGKFVDPAKEHE